MAVAPPLLLPAGYETSVLLPKLTSERSLLPDLTGGCLPFTPAAAALEVLSGFVKFSQVLPGSAKSCLKREKEKFTKVVERKTS